MSRLETHAALGATKIPRRDVADCTMPTFHATFRRGGYKNMTYYSHRESQPQFIELSLSLSSIHEYVLERLTCIKFWLDRCSGKKS
jgi:hypothetical protein